MCLSTLAILFRSRFLIAAFALLLRLGLCCEILQTVPFERFWKASEPGNIAAALIEGKGFRSPYDRSQPTAWVAPAYPALIVAPVFRIFGAYSRTSLYALMFLNAVFGALTVFAIYRIGERFFDTTTAAVASWLWAVSLSGAVMPLLVWDTCLSALLFSLGFLMTLSLLTSTSYLRWATVGLFWGLVCLVNPALLAPVPFLLLVLWIAGRKRAVDVSKHVLVAIAMVVLTVAPWLWRNYRVFHTPVFIRSNFPAELYYGSLGFESHPFGRTNEYQKMGELAYVASKRALVMAYVRQHPSEFFSRSLHRMIAFWTVPAVSRNTWMLLSLLMIAGLVRAMYVKRFCAICFLVVLIYYPTTYYMTYVFPKYRHPIEPIMMLMAAYAIVQASAAIGVRKLSKGGIDISPAPTLPAEGRSVCRRKCS